MENTVIPNTLRRLLFIFGVLLTISLLASGANVYMTLAAPQRSVTVPNVVGLEGRLADSSGNPLANGDYQVTFSLYSQASGGTALWSEVQTVTTQSGLYSVQLGATTALQPSHFNGARWLGVKVGTGDELTPRVSIGAVPFALNAQEAVHAEQADQAAEATHAAEADQAAQAQGLQGRNVSTSAPTDGQALVWNAAGSVWFPSTLPTPQAAQYPRRAFGFHGNDLIVTGGALTRVHNASQDFSHYAYQNPAANGNTFTTSIMLRAGTYTLSVLGITANNKGKIDWYVDDVLQISGQDWYSSSATYNVVKSGSITVVGDGYHILKGVVNGKNASSSAYQMWLTEWWIAPTSD